MEYKIKLKNAPQDAILDEKGYQEITKNTYLQKIKFAKNLRKHSNGYAVFQRSYATKKGLMYETIYLHKHLAEKFIKKPNKEQRFFVRFKNGNPLDCRLDNFEWRTMGELRRLMKNFTSKSGYRGVMKEKKKFRSVIYYNGKPVSLGSFDTAEEAAKAYNKKSKELFGDVGFQNEIKK